MLLLIFEGIILFLISISKGMKDNNNNNNRFFIFQVTHVTWTYPTKHLCALPSRIAISKPHQYGKNYAKKNHLFKTHVVFISSLHSWSEWNATFSAPTSRALWTWLCPWTIVPTLNCRIVSPTLNFNPTLFAIPCKFLGIIDLK